MKRKKYTVGKKLQFMESGQFRLTLLVVLGMIGVLSVYIQNETWQSIIELLVLLGMATICYYTFRKYNTFFKETVACKDIVIVSKYAKKKALGHKKFLIFLDVSIFLFICALLNLYFVESKESQELYLLEVNVIFYCFFIIYQAFWIDFTIIFRQESYISGLNIIRYSDIDVCNEIKRIHIMKEDIVFFELHRDGKVVGFDKMMESDFMYLCKKIEILKNHPYSGK